MNLIKQHTGFNVTSAAVITRYPQRSHMLDKVKYCLIRFISQMCVCVCGEPTNPKLKISDLGVICPLRASGAMYAQVPTIFSVIMVVDVPLGEALVNPKSEIFATSFSSNRIFALTRQNESVDRL